MTDLFTYKPPAAEAFDGKTYDPDRDYRRLDHLLGRVYRFMQDGAWHTLGTISHATGGSEASVSARLRDLRKPRYGALHIERRHLSDGLWQYRLASPDPAAEQSCNPL